MYIAVCDDQAEDLNDIDALLCAWETERNLPLHRKLFSNAVELLDAARRENFTLYLLDVIMSGVNGMSAARELRDLDHTANIVFLTSSPEFAWESYRVQALDYLLKPVDKGILFGLLDKLYCREQRPQEALILKTGPTILRILFSELSFVEVIGKRLYFNMTNGDVREITGSMKTYEEQLLSRPEFMRVHRSYIVNMLQVEELSSSHIRTFSGKSLPVSRLLYPQLPEDYMALLFEQRG
ncbi:MAG: LytTR family DNA-binding domain-containing protein [Oscillospiraceae bacterium]|nr:LytTR family DNA-binding domain-containing protein [Oscillospiraceae bacterium]